uniref:Uncharacterized protein n=1 Tax=Nelumbo nucifera TaxID=4432 RepID=A0A822YNJ3_NELNU|nr:TPA_asm: hypothetical protein HUJ06_004727 [Nelumbo nucifera]
MATATVLLPSAFATAPPIPTTKTLPIRNASSSKVYLLRFPSSSSSSYSFSSKLTFRKGLIKCKALRETSRDSFNGRTVYQGVYGPWAVDPSDVREVMLIIFPFLFIFPFHVLLSIAITCS